MNMILGPDGRPYTQAASSGGHGSIFGRVARRAAQTGSVVSGNPLAFAVAGGVAATAGGLALANRERQRRAAPEQIGSQIGSSSNFDAMSELSDRQKDMMANWDEGQNQQFQTAIAESAENAVRLGQMTPEEAQARVARANFTLGGGSTNNSGQLQMGAMSAVDLPNATAGLGDYNTPGLDDEYFSQLRNAALAQENITQGVGDMQLSREFDRTAKYRLPLENYRMNRDFAYGQKGEQNAMKRQMASGMLNTYANTAQQLITSGL